MESNNDHFWKFNEGEILKQVKEYIISTYESHYADDASSVQAIELINSIGNGISFSQSSIIKYAARYGKKDGLSKRDALKIIHYGILMYHFSKHDIPFKNQYETFQ